MRDIDIKYLNMLLQIYKSGKDVCPRGLNCKELMAYRFELEDISGDKNIITLPGLETKVDYANEELDWYLSGNPSIDYSPRIKRVWEKFSDDGVRVNSNYGERIFGKHPRMPVNQWQWVKDELMKDKDSRKAVININSWFDKEKPTKDLPCTNTIQYFIRDNKLDSIVNMRSNDAYLGFRNDLYCFTELQKLMANELGIQPGKYIHVSNSMHLYEKDYSKLERYLK